MNKKEAYQLTIDLWKDIADSNYAFKEQSKYFDKVREMSHSCPLCEVARDRLDCKGCPLFVGDLKCFMEGGVFYFWAWKETKEKPKVAYKIVRLVQEAYDELK